MGDMEPLSYDDYADSEQDPHEDQDEEDGDADKPQGPASKLSKTAKQVFDTGIGGAGIRNAAAHAY